MIGNIKFAKNTNHARQERITFYAIVQVIR